MAKSDVNLIASVAATLAAANNDPTADAAVYVEQALTIVEHAQAAAEDPEAFRETLRAARDGDDDEQLGH